MALREFREGAAYTARETAQRLGFSESKLSRIETAIRLVSDEDLERMCALYGVVGAERDRLLSLAAESRLPGWWAKYDVPYAEFIGLESTASSILDFSNIIPGLLQAPGYARGIAEGIHEYVSGRRINDLVEVKALRQRILDGTAAPEYRAVVDESALHRMIGGVEAYREQLDHLVKRITGSAISFRVIPYAAGWHNGVDLQLTILSFPGGVHDVVYQDLPDRERYLQTAREVEAFREVFAKLEAKALGVADSLQLVRDLMTR
jgi:transcriptional regulator with XRE-family HTH domain